MQIKCAMWNKIKRVFLVYICTMTMLCGLLSGCGSTEPNVIEPAYFVELPTDEQKSSIYVEKIDGLSPDFIRGIDISSLLVEEKSGVKYYDANGEEQDLFKLLADAGVNCIRVRVWNDPFDEEGNGYGGGNCTAETAALLGARAACYNIDTCVDFHYSDFWADPGKQMEPKAWADMELSGKKEALYAYTYESLHTIMDAGARVTMVQIGNETNNGMAGIPSFGGITELLNQGSKAVRKISEEYGTDIKVVVHFTQIDDASGTLKIAEKLMKYKVDYDVFGVSYYPYWHGTMANMQKVLTDIHDTYGVETCIMENSYPYTTEDGDGSGNSVSMGTDDYPVSVQGQASEIRDVCSYANEAGALGVFYWEGAWIPVNPQAAKENAPEDETSKITGNSSLWEMYGSGWASSYAAGYDPKDAGKFYGGCSWDNQALFDFDGNQLDSLNVFKYIYCGSVGEGLEIIKIDDLDLAFAPGSEVVMPKTFPVSFNDPTYAEQIPVTWNNDELSLIDINSTGKYTVNGVLELPNNIGIIDSIKQNTDGSIPVVANINVNNENLLANASFEDTNTDMWIVTPISGDNPSDFQKKTGDAHTGDVSFHFWSQSDMNFVLEQAITVTEAGTYSAECFMQGGDFGADSEVYLYISVGDEKEKYTSSAVALDGWCNWKNPQINDISLAAGDVVTVGAYVKAPALAWATFDDFTLMLQ